MKDRKLCSINDCINYIDVNNHCDSDDNSRLHAAITKIILSFEEVIFSINVEIRISKVGGKFPLADF
jgi:hypothetical protein